MPGVGLLGQPLRGAVFARSEEQAEQVGSHLGAVGAVGEEHQTFFLVGQRHKKALEIAVVAPVPLGQAPAGGGQPHAAGPGNEGVGGRGELAAASGLVGRRAQQLRGGRFQSPPRHQSL